MPKIRTCVTAAMFVLSTAMMAADTAGSVDLTQSLGNRVPSGIAFVDERGTSVRFGDLLGERPVALALGYYDCPNLCGIAFNAYASALAALTLESGKDYGFVFVSIDPEETPAHAAASKRAYQRRFGRPEHEAGWSFLTGEEDSIRKLATAIGFGYRYDEAAGQYAHPSGLIVLTPEGVTSKYFYGIEYDPKALRLALVEASSGSIGTAVDQIILLCFHYNPLTGKYSVAIDRVIKATGLLTVASLGIVIGFLIRTDKRRKGKIG